MIDKQKELEIVAQELLEKEIIFQSDLEKLIGKRPFERPTTYEEFTNRKVNGDGSIDLNTEALENHVEEKRIKESENERSSEENTDTANDSPGKDNS